MTENVNVGSLSNKFTGQNSCRNARNLINNEDLSVIQKEQKVMLEQLEKINQMLSSCNDISEKQIGNLYSRFQQHTAVLIDMKKNLNFIHSHIRQMKATLREKHPELQNKSRESKKSSQLTITSAAGLESSNNSTGPE